MKRKLPFLLVILLCTAPLISQDVNIPDTNFLNALLELGFDLDADGQISISEAEAVTEININPLGYGEGCEKNNQGSITSLAGISSFTNLEKLDCGCNKIKKLDLSLNTQLTELVCSNNIIDSLGVSGCGNLSSLYCEGNWLTSLDLGANTLLKNLTCSSNYLSSLDLTKNTELRTFYGDNNFLSELNFFENTKLIVAYCYSNKLEYCIFTNCTSLTMINLEFMPTLETVCVWTTPFPPETVNVFTEGSPNITYTTSCGGLGVHDAKEGPGKIYPNPFKNSITIQDVNASVFNLKVISLNGKILHSENCHHGMNEIDLSWLPEGIYMAVMTTNEETIIEKLVKQ